MKDYPKLKKLNYDELDMVSGGREIEKEETRAEGYCTSCGKMVPVAVFSGGRYRCCCLTGIMFNILK